MEPEIDEDPQAEVMRAYEQGYDELISIGYSDKDTREYLDWKFNVTS